MEFFAGYVIGIIWPKSNGLAMRQELKLGENEIREKKEKNGGFRNERIITGM